MVLEPCSALRLGMVYVSGGGLLLVEAGNTDPLNGPTLQVSYTLLVWPLAVCGLYRLSLIEGNLSSRTPRLAVSSRYSFQAPWVHLIYISYIAVLYTQFHLTRLCVALIRNDFDYLRLWGLTVEVECSVCFHTRRLGRVKE
jgi:hypothetical protein